MRTRTARAAGERRRAGPAVGDRRRPAGRGIRGRGALRADVAATGPCEAVQSGAKTPRVGLFEGPRVACEMGSVCLGFTAKGIVDDFGTSFNHCRSAVGCGRIHINI
jgi:hypothetical protein